MEQIYKTVNDSLDEALQRAIQFLEEPNHTFDERKEALDHLFYIMNQKFDLADKPKRPSIIKEIVSNPALLGVIGNLAGILLILNYERMNVVTSRAFSFIKSK